jgi:pseudo-rSAM protein
LVPGCPSTKIYLNISLIKSILNQLPPNKKDGILNFIIKDIFEYRDMQELIYLLEEGKMKKKITSYYTGLMEQEKMQIISDAGINLDIYIDFPVQKNRIKPIQELSKYASSTISCFFLISSEEELISAEKLVETYVISRYTFVPVYTGDNDDFFERNIFLSEEDILLHPVSMREIFIHQTLNIESFGKLAILASGSVYSNLFSPEIGTIQEHSLLEILYKELDSVGHWLKVRTCALCENCRYQWLCPLPTNYEQLLHKNNLCQIRKK